MINTLVAVFANKIVTTHSIAFYNALREKSKLATMKQENSKFVFWDTFVEYSTNLAELYSKLQCMS